MTALKGNPAQRPRLRIQAIMRVLLRQAEGPLPETRLVVAVICQAIVDLGSEAKKERTSAGKFLEGPGLERWASWVDLNPAFIRELARKGGFLTTPAEQPNPPITTPATHLNGKKGRNHAGLQ